MIEKEWTPADDQLDVDAPENKVDVLVPAPVGKVVETLTDDEAALYSILQDPSGLDQAEFFWFAQDEPDGCFRAWPFQWAWWRSSEGTQIDQCARALDVSTKIPTPSGWTTMGELLPGDVVYDETGSSTRVRAVSQVWTDRPSFEVCFDDHTSIVADADHLWSTWDKKARVAQNPKRRGIPLPRVRTTAEIAATLRVRGEQNHAIDVAGALQTSDADLLLDPYYVGYWLGDGNSHDSEITTIDMWVLEEFQRRGFEIVDRAAEHRYGIRFPGVHNRKTKSVQAMLRRLEILDNKHIPDVYLRSSEQQRRALLAGLVDSDGHMQSNGSCEVTQKNERIANGLVEVLRSLGEKPRVTKKTATLNGIDCGPVFRVTWRPRVNPALMPRKRAGFTEPALRKRALSQRRIVDVRAVPSVPVRCITVDSPTHLFLAGEGMVPTHNSVGKSMSIKVRGCAFPFVHPGQEMVVTAPELVHLEPIVNLIENQFYQTRFYREMLPRGRSAVTHRPFQMNFLNGARIIGRIPQRDGRGVKGIHPIWLELDEAQDYPDQGWTELTETLQRGKEGAVWRAHGVTRGVRDKFYEYTQDTPDNMWKVHRYPAMYRPNWTDEERTAKESEYGGKEDADYRRNVLGLHGDNTNPLFVLASLMKCVDVDTTTEYNIDEYYNPGWGRSKRSPNRVSSDNLNLFEQDITDVLDYPRHHLTKYRLDGPTPGVFWIGMDIGFTIDPTELLIWVEYRPEKAKKDAPPKIRMIGRVCLVRMPHPEQVKAILHTIDFYKPKAFAMDKGGNGLPLFQAIQSALKAIREGRTDEVPPWMSRYDLEEALETIKGYNFSEKLTIDIDESVKVDQFDDPLIEAAMKRNAKEYGSDELRDLVDNQRLELPWDADMLKQFSGATWTNAKGLSDMYGRRIFSKGNDHTLDASRFMALGHAQNAIEEMIASRDHHEPVLDIAMW